MSQQFSYTIGVSIDSLYTEIKDTLMRILSTSIIILIAGASFSQNFDYLDHNNTNVALPVIGSFFSDVAQGQPGYEVPKGSGNHTMYHARFYFMGLDNNGTLHASLGGSSNGTDVFSGPYSSLDNYDSTYQAYWNGHSSQLCQEEIDNYAIWWEACEGPNQGPQACANAISPSNATLTQIYNWPAHGNASNGEEFYLAPYYDHPESNPGIYDPIDGDYPLIKGCCATYRIDNDAAGTHTFSGADPLGIETHYQTFQYKNFGLLNDVTFVEVTVHNRGTTTYPEFVYGMYADTDLGEPFDDYIGSDSTRSMYYTYNGDNNDANYGIDPPAFGIVGLESPFTSVVQYNGTSSLPEIWNMMNGLSFNGQPILDGQGNTTGFEYGSNPNALGGSSELELQNAAGDRRAMLSTEHGAFAPGGCDYSNICISVCARRR